MVDRLAAFDVALESGAAKPRYTAEQVTVDLEPKAYDAAAITAIRRSLDVSQPVFAKLLGASTATVQAWEAGTRSANGIARRLLEQVERHPEQWTARLHEVVGSG